MPIVGVLLDSVDCIEMDDGSGTGARLVWALESSPNVTCGSTFHMMLASSCMFMLTLYTMLALRIQRVRGNLSSIEFDWKRPWTLRNDMLVEQYVRHPLQPVEDESKDPSDVGVINTVSAEFHDRNRVSVELLRFRLSLCCSCKGRCAEAAQHHRFEAFELIPRAHCSKCNHDGSILDRGADLCIWKR